MCVKIPWLSGCDIKDNALFSLIAILTIGPLSGEESNPALLEFFYEYQP